jgi:hypothetical protein
MTLISKSSFLALIVSDPLWSVFICGKVLVFALPRDPAKKGKM